MRDSREFGHDWRRQAYRQRQQIAHIPINPRNIEICLRQSVYKYSQLFGGSTFQCFNLVTSVGQIDQLFLPERHPR